MRSRGFWKRVYVSPEDALGRTFSNTRRFPISWLLNVGASAECFNERIDLSRFEPNCDLSRLFVMHPDHEQNVTTRGRDYISVDGGQTARARLVQTFSIRAIPRDWPH